MAEVIQSFRSPGGRSSASTSRSSISGEASSSSSSSSKGASMTPSSSTSSWTEYQDVLRKMPPPSPSERPSMSRGPSSTSSRRSSTTSSSSLRTLAQPKPQPRTLSDELSDRSSIASGSTTPLANTQSLPSMARRRSSEGGQRGTTPSGSVTPRSSSSKRMSRSNSSRQSIGLFIAMSPGPSSPAIAGPTQPFPSAPRGPPPREALPDPQAGAVMSNDNSAAAKESPRPPSLRGRISSVLALIVKFFRDIARTWTRILLEVLLPFSSDFIGVPALRSANPGNVTSAPLPTGLSLSRSRRSFAERFKYTVVTSFLLTATLSISMYGSEAAVHEDEAAIEEERKLLGESMPVSKPAIETTRASMPSPRHTLASIVRNAIVWAVALLWYFSPSTQQWFRTSLLVVCCAWSLSLLVTSLGKAEKRRSPLHFELVQPSSNCVPSAPLSSYLAEKRAHASLNEGVSHLVKTACDTDVELNRSLAALQEIELVARGFKIGQQHQHFMPPISRIEAATNGAPSRNSAASQLYSPPFNGKRSVSLTSTESNVKHSCEQRRASPPPPPMHRMLQLRAGLSQAFEDAERASKEFGEALEPLADPKELEQLGDMYSLDQIAGAGSSEDDYTAGLASMASKRVAGLASPPLIASSSSRFTTPTSHRRAFSHLAGSPSQSMTPGAAAASGDWDDSFTSTPGSKRGSWTNATLPRSFGSTAASAGLSSSHHKRRGSNIALAPMMLTAGVSAVAKPSNDGDAAAPPLSSSSSSSASINSGKRYSNDSLGGSSQVSSSTGLGRSGSLLRNRNGEAITWDQQAGGPGEGVGASPSAPPRSGSRLSYISEGSVSSGPNGSPAAKRMSYQHQQQSIDPKHGSVLESRPNSRLSATSSSLGAVTVGADGQEAKHHLASPPHSANSATSSSTSASAAGAGAAAASSPMHWQQQQQPQSPKRPTTAGPLSTSSPPHSSSSMTIGRAGSLRSIRRTLFTPPTTSSGTALGVASTSFETDAAHQHHIGSALPSPSAGPAAAAAAAAAGGGQYDPFSLLGLRQSFERFHLVRRRALCLLLALEFEGAGAADDAGKQEDSQTSDKRGYWDKVAKAMQRLSLQLEVIKERMTKAVDEEMNHFSGKVSSPTAASPGAAAVPSASGPTHLLPGSQGLLPFTGLDDRAEALVSSLRSIQVKIRACNEELLMDWPAPAVSLHGSSNAGPQTGEGQDVWGQSVVSQRKENAERLWDSIREDLLAVTQEWEGGMKLFRAEKARAAAAAAANSSTTPAADASRLESPLEVDEERYGDLEDDELDVDPTTTTSSSHADSHSRSASINSAEDLASSLLRLRAASPPPSSPRLDSSSIPGSPSIPRGLEQIFESIAGIAVSLQEEEKEKRRKRQASAGSASKGGGGAAGGSTKLTREERIARVKSQRAELERRRTLGLPLELPRESLSGSDAGGVKPHGGVVTELKDVLSGIRVKRERQREEAEAARASVASSTPSNDNRGSVSVTTPAAAGGSSSTDSNLTLAATSTSCGSSSRTSATTWSSVATPATSTTATTTGSNARSSAPASPSTPPTPQSPQPQPPPRPPRGGVPASPPRVRKESTQGDGDGDDSDEKTLAAATAAAAAAAVRARRGRQGSGTKVGTT